ncbi:zinc finger BED domain-containing protein RICESLEEPER 3-like [Monomorium pharaonis]|uniref:zinc finger BED domain-containing protein RICESLEEPER 3-like n=1 Tax=Monomorium pharaonis TaxID=307658 RepID=UPI001745EC1F|nr:zinc finger BED domain-containing protein RICESLEEPER 3-like [Monomorium pharaonis]
MVNRSDSNALSESYPTPRKQRRLNDCSVSCSAQKQETITEAVTTLIATNQLPISVVSSAGFKNFMSIVEPGYRVSCEKTIVKRLEVLYDKVKAKVTEDLQEAKSVSLTVDEWSSRARESFLSVEAQYIDKNLHPKHVTLNNDSLDGRPNAANIASEIKNVIQKWNLSSKVKAIVHDSAFVMNAACNILEEADNSIKCSAHILQLAVKDALTAVSEFEQVTTKGRSTVSHFQKSNVASKALSERQKQQNLKQKCLKQSVETRWDSEFFML